jgi:hypothetical protein
MERIEVAPAAAKCRYCGHGWCEHHTLATPQDADGNPKGTPIPCDAPVGAVAGQTCGCVRWWPVPKGMNLLEFQEAQIAAVEKTAAELWPLFGFNVSSEEAEVTVRRCIENDPLLKGVSARELLAEAESPGWFRRQS